ncbi:hypothetical protein C0993_001939 [Termitomyces sp. T159_Od127]|nr:hypothetical protein C0993_001939 [Termitomyces sp. T159_Od127]
MEHYDNIAAEVKRTFVHLAMLRERKAREAAYSNNRYVVEQHHQRLRSQQPHVVLPSLDVFRRLPIVQLLQGTSPGTIEFPPKHPPHHMRTTLLKENWVVERLKTELCQWREKARKDLAAVLGYPNWTALNANANSTVMHPVDRVTARFLCKTCSKVASRYREDDSLDFAGACAHLCPGKKDKRVHGVWTAERFIKDEKAVATLENLLTLCTIDASAYEAATTLESLGTTIQCTTCGPGIVVDFRSLVGHSHRHDKMMIRKYAWGHDDLLPLNKSFTDGRNGATIIDAMSTMYIMGLNDSFKEAVAHVSSVDFSTSHTDDTVSVFETTIRYLGGMLSAYELSNYQYPVLLEKAQLLGDKLIKAWSGGSDIPWSRLDFASNEPVGGTVILFAFPRFCLTFGSRQSNIAEAGTMTMEFGTLSRYTQDSKYRELAERAVRRVASQPAPLPGLPAQGIDPATGKPIGDYVTWGGGSDSYFEYLIKYPRLFSDADDFFVDNWRLAVDSSIKTLLQLEFSAQYGFYPTASYYILRPEVLESNFYAWRNTGDPKFIARAASALDSFTKYLRFDGAYTGLWDVNNKNSTRVNDMESFWFAEVLKYLPGFPTPTSTKPFQTNEGNTPEISQIAGMPSIKKIIQGILVDDVE